MLALKIPQLVMVIFVSMILLLNFYYAGQQIFYRQVF